MLGPTQPEERIQTLDVLRGFALFGVLLSNLNGEYSPAPAARLPDVVLQGVQWSLLEGRFYTLLGFLFGIGFAMQLLRAEASGEDVSGPYRRRLGALLAIGVLHGTLIWHGDVLTLYATTGFALLLVRGVPPRGLLVAAAVAFFALPLVGSAVVGHFGLVAVPRPDRSNADLIYAAGSAGRILAQRVSAYLDWYGRSALEAMPGFLTLFILGLWLGRVGFVKDLPNRMPAVRRALFVAALCLAAGMLMDRNFARWWPAPSGPAGSFAEFVKSIPRFEANLVVEQLTRWSMTAIYACALTLLVSRSSWMRALQPLASVGRMPLTTYLTQSVVCTLLFYAYGLGLYGRVSFMGMFAIAVVLFALQMAASAWWLRRHRFGPMELLWRRVTYGGSPARARAAPADIGVPATSE